MMVSFFAGICDLCGEVRPMATPEQVKAAGLDLDAAVCVECVARAVPPMEKTPEPGKPS